jgi:hypothetical protein
MAATIAAQPTSGVFEHGTRPSRNRRAHPQHPAVLRGGPVSGPGAEHRAGRGYVDPDDSEDEALRAAGGPGPKSSTWTERGALTVRVMAGFAPRL